MKRPGGFDRDEAESGEPGTSRGGPKKARAPRRTARDGRSRGVGSRDDEELTRAVEADRPSSAPAEPLTVVDAVPATPMPVPAEPRPDERVRSAERALARARSSVRKRERREMRRFTAHLRRRRRNWLIVGGAVLALAIFVGVGALSPLMAVREVQVTGTSRVSVEKLQTALERFEGTPLTLVSDQEVHRALEPFPLIQRYSIERIPPHTLLVRIEERDPVIAIERDGKVQLLDPAGVLVAETDKAPAGVPLAEGTVADPGSPAFAAAGLVIRDLPADIRKRVVGVRASSAQDVELTLKDGTRVIWGEASDIQKKAAVLRAMSKSVPRASLIDLSAPDAPVFE